MSAMHGTLRVVLGICTFNRGGAIVQTLDSIATMLRSGDGGWCLRARVMVVNNNSTDDTESVVRAWAARNGDVRVDVVLEVRQGLTHARRCLFASSDEPLVAWVDDDVLLNAAWLDEHVCVMERDERVGMVGGRVQLRYLSRPSAIAVQNAQFLAAQDYGDEEREIGGGADGVPEGLVGAAVLLRRSAVEATGWIKGSELSDRLGEALSSGGDYELGIRVRQAGYRLWYTPAGSATHLIPESRVTKGYLIRLAAGISRAEPMLSYLQAGMPRGEAGEAWVQLRLLRAEKKLRRTRWLEWRPMRRQFRLAQRRARLEGWEELLERVRDREAGEKKRLAGEAKRGEPGAVPRGE